MGNDVVDELGGSLSVTGRETADRGCLAVRPADTAARDGGRDECRRASISLKRAHRGIAAVAVAMSIGLTACADSEERAVPSPTAELELVIVTPTPGSPRSVAPTPVRGGRYLVQERDTLSAIAAEHGLTEIEIQEANDLDNPDQLIPGQELIIPSPEP